MEGEEKTLNNSPQGHSEFELTLVLIFFGLFGIAFLALYVGSDGFGRIISSSNSITIPVDDGQVFAAVEDKDVESLMSIIVTLAAANEGDSAGDYFVHPFNLKALYVSDEECKKECLDNWTPYYASESVGLGKLFTIVREDNQKLQYAWKGLPIYTNTSSAKLDTSKDGMDNSWHVVRP